MTLCSATGTVERSTLRAMPDPVPLEGSKYHKPVRHDVLLDQIEEKLEDRGWKVSDVQVALSKDAMRMFYTMDLVPSDDSLIRKFRDGVIGRVNDEGRAFMIGGRHGNDQSMSLRGVAGTTGFVCDNMMLNGKDFLFKRKHTMNTNLPELVAGGIDKLPLELEKNEQGIWEMAAHKISDREAELKLYDAFLNPSLPRVAATAYGPEVARTYFEATPLNAPEVADNHGNMWGLHNAFTRTFRKMTPENKFKSTQRLGEFTKVTA